MSQGIPFAALARLTAIIDSQSSTGAAGSGVVRLGWLAGLLAFSTGWIALGWAAVRLDRPAAATA